MRKIVTTLVEDLKQSRAVNAEPKGTVVGDAFLDKLMTGYDNFSRQSREDGEYFSPSSIAYRNGKGSCPRFWYYKWRNGTWVESFPAKSVAAMDNGTDSHLRMGVLFEASELDVVDVERKLRSVDPPIEGSIDFVVDRRGEEVLVEFKTTRTESFEARKRKGDAMDYHIMQLCIYLYMAGLENGIVLYENRNDFEMLAIPVSFSDNADNVESTLDWLRQVWEAHQNDQLPANVFTWENPVACAECPFQEQCYADPVAGDIRIERSPKLDWRSQ